MFSYEGKRVLVTGAGRGIGRAIVLDMARQGADVCVASRSEGELKSVVAEVEALGRRAWFRAADLSKAETGQELVPWAVEKMGGLDVLVNNAGGASTVPGGKGPLESATYEGMRAIYGLNLETPFFTCVAAIEHMKQNGGGALLNVASIDGVRTAPGEAVYGSAKAALISLSQALGVELGQYNIRVNAIAPALIDTQLVQKALSTDEQRADRASYYPINRVGKPEDISSAAVYLCSDEAGWVSGVTLVVAGGQQATSDLFRWIRAHNPVPESARI
jgi:NAD(P)-dependent dehydrogenase (short-subunit alcohol dehydrogenase family)